jgi:hypothetical protein
MRWLRSAAVFESTGFSLLKSPRYFCDVSGSMFRNAVPVSCSALTSSVSCTMRRAWWSPHAATQAAHPLHRSETKIEKTPPLPGLFRSGVAKMAFAFW